MKNKLSKQQSNAELAAILHENGIRSKLQLVEVKQAKDEYCIVLHLTKAKLQHLKLDYKDSVLYVKGTLLREFSLFNFLEKIEVGTNFNMKHIRINHYSTYISIDVPVDISK